VRVCVPQLPHVWDAAPEQVHLPAWQEDPVGQACPQPPQSFASVVVSTQPPRHAV
jgi:hypothetical protein